MLPKLNKNMSQHFEPHIVSDCHQQPSSVHPALLHPPVADDTTVYLTIISMEDGEKLQQDLTKLELWENEWMADFHMEKCNVLRLTD